MGRDRTFASVKENNDQINKKNKKEKSSLTVDFRLKLTVGTFVLLK